MRSTSRFPHSAYQQAASRGMPQPKGWIARGAVVEWVVSADFEVQVRADSYAAGADVSDQFQVIYLLPRLDSDAIQMSIQSKYLFAGG